LRFYFIEISPLQAVKIEGATVLPEITQDLK